MTNRASFADYHLWRPEFPILQGLANDLAVYLQRWPIKGDIRDRIKTLSGMPDGEPLDTVVAMVEERLGRDKSILWKPGCNEEGD